MGRVRKPLYVRMCCGRGPSALRRGPFACSSSAWAFLLLANLCALFSTPVAAAEIETTRSLAGTYRNLSFNVDGAGGANRLMPPLILFAHQQYTWGQEKGTWSEQQNKLRLSARPAWGEATVNSDRQLRFEFAKDGKRYTVTLYRAGDAPVPDKSTSAVNPPVSAATDGAAVYEFRQQHDPDGIGKFYMGREIAHVMGHQAADWLERPEREDEEKPDAAVEALQVKPGDAVADIGAGTGYFTRRLARLVGEKGAVYAVEIQPEMLVLLTNKMTQLGFRNVKPVLGTITDPKLPPSSVDLVLMVDVYHEFSHPHEMMTAIRAALKPNGRVAFVEYRAEDPTVPIKPVHKMTEAQVRKEAATHGLVWAETIRTLPRQHIIICRKPVVK